MAAEVVPLEQLKLPAGPSPVSSEQRYWQSFKNQLLIPSVTSSSITHIASPASVTAFSTAAGSSSSSFTAQTNTDLFAVTSGTRVQLFSSRTRKLVKTITRFGDVARSGEIRRDGRVLVAGEDSGRIQVFDVGSRAILRTWMTAQRQPVWATRFSPVDATTLLSAGDDKTVRLWDLTAPEPTATFYGHEDYARCAEFVPGRMANLVVSGSYDGTVRLWDARQGGKGSRAVQTFKHKDPVEAVLPMGTGTTLVAAAGSNVSVLDLVAARPLTMLGNHQKTVTCLSLASGGRRLLTGGLEGHVKVFETTDWNVVVSIKFPSPVLALGVIAGGAGAGGAGEAAAARDGAQDRHLVVGMASGLLSIRTRLSGTEAKKKKEKEKMMAAMVAGTADKLEARQEKKKRRRAAEGSGATARMDLVGEGEHVVIANQPRSQRRKKEPGWQHDLRMGRHAKALDGVLALAAAARASALDVLTLLAALRHRSALREALAGRDEAALRPITRWVCAHLVDPRYVGVCVEVGLIMLDLYAEFAGGSAELGEQFSLLYRKVTAEVEKAQVAVQTGGMVESLMIGAV